jgi:glycosyltransferase involved in cell wall biosynthesis
MACGLPVVTTDRGGNPEVVNDPGLGIIVPFGEATALFEAIETGLDRDWDSEAIIRYARLNSWNGRIDQLDAAIASVLRRQ